MRAHTITTKALVGGGGRPKRKRTIAPGGILALSLAVVLLAATASTAGAHRGVRMSLDGPASVGFGDREVGTTSPAQAFTLRVGCRPTVSGCEAGSRNPKISVPGDYAQTNDCPPTMLSGQSCTINVTFAPASTGPKTGTLRTGRTACVKKANSPQHHDHSCEAPTATLNGNGVGSPTPPTPPLTLDASAHQDSVVAGPLKLYAFTNRNSTLVVRGRKIKKTKKTTEPLAGDEAAGYRAVIRVRPKHPSRLDRPGWLAANIKVTATDEFGQRATVEFEKKRFYLWPRP